MKSCVNCKHISRRLSESPCNKCHRIMGTAGSMFKRGSSGCEMSHWESEIDTTLDHILGLK